MALNAGSVIYELGGKLDDRAFKLYDKQIEKSIKVTGELVKTQEKAAKVNEALSRSVSKGVADTKKAADAQSKLASSTEKTGKATDQAGKSVDKFGNEIKKTDAAMGRFYDKSGRLREANGRYVRSTEQAAKQTKSFHSSIGRLTTGLGVGAGLGMALRFVGKTAGDYEAQMSKLKTITGANEVQMKAFGKQALKAGGETKFSALEAAQAQIELAKGGMKLTTIMNGGLDGALSLAAAGELDLADAAGTTVTALNLFKLQGKDATHVADMLAQSANNTTADVSHFADALDNGGGVAKAAGLSIEETMTVLNAFADVGLKGAEAGTTMKSMYLALINPSTKAAEAMKQYGIKVTDANGNMKSAAELSAMLAEKTKGMNRQQRLSLFSTIAGSYGVRGLNALYEAGEGKLNKYRESMNKVGIAQKTAKGLQDNAKESWKNFMGSVETLAIIFATDYLPTIGKVIRQATVFLNVFAGLPKPVRLVAAALLGLGGALYVITRLTLAIRMMNMAMKANVWVMIAMAIIAVVYLIYKNWDAISKRLMKIWKGIKDAFHDVANFFKKMARSGFLGPAILILAHWREILSFFKALPKRILSFFAGLGAKMVSPFVSAFKSLRGAITDSLNWLKRAFNNTIKFLTNAYNKLPEWTKKLISAGGDAVGFIISKVAGKSKGGKVGPGAGGAQLFVAGEGNKSEYVLSHEGDKKKNVGYALSFLKEAGIGAFRKGGRVKKPAPGAVSSESFITGVAGLQKAKRRADAMVAYRERLEREYSIKQKDFELSGEGIDQGEYRKLADIRKSINDSRGVELSLVSKALPVFKGEIKNLRRKMSSARGDKRTKIKDQLENLLELQKEFRERKTELGFSVREGRLDLIELEKQAKEEANKKAEEQAQQGASLSEQFASFNSSRFDLLRSFGGNTSSIPVSTLATAAAGQATGKSANNAPVINNTYTTAPPDPAAWNKQMELQIKAAS